MSYVLPFEKPLLEVEQQLAALRTSAGAESLHLTPEIDVLEQKLSSMREALFASITPYQRTQFARHPKRPSALDIINAMSQDFTELHGDRNFHDDPAIVGGFTRIGPYTVMIVAHQKGKTTKENIHRNFGMPKPEGYRKALRLMSMAERFKIPIVTLIDTPGAYPGIGAEQRGQSEAIAKNIYVMMRLNVPILSFVIGEGGSGGALAIGVANKIIMLEHAVYSVISPEGCASILFKSASMAEDAANALKLTAEDAHKLGVCDLILKEPQGGAHKDHEAIAASISTTIIESLDELSKHPRDLSQERIEKFLKMGAHFIDEA